MTAKRYAAMTCRNAQIGFQMQASAAEHHEASGCAEPV
jgi:hypothetical protein